MPTRNGADRAEEFVEDVRQEVIDFRREAYQKAEDVRKEAVKQLNNVAKSIRREVRDAKADEESIKRADEIAKRLEKTAHYMNSHSVDEMGEDATRIVTRNPWRAMVIALVVGLLLGLILRGDDR